MPAYSVILINMIINYSNRFIPYLLSLYITTDLFYIMCIETESMAVTWCEDLHVREPENWLTFTGGWAHRTFKCRDLSVMLGDGYINWEAERERGTVKEIGRDCECKREMGGWTLLPHKISFSPHSPFFICITEEEKDCEEKNKKSAGLRQQTSIVPTAVQQSCFVEGRKKIRCERTANWITGVRIPARRERKGWKRILENFYYME